MSERGDLAKYRVTVNLGRELDAKLRGVMEPGEQDGSRAIRRILRAHFFGPAVAEDQAPYGDRARAEAMLDVEQRKDREKKQRKGG